LITFNVTRLEMPQSSITYNAIMNNSGSW